MQPQLVLSAPIRAEGRCELELAVKRVRPLAEGPRLGQAV